MGVVENFEVFTFEEGGVDALDKRWFVTEVRKVVR